MTITITINSVFGWIIAVCLLTLTAAVTLLVFAYVKECCNLVRDRKSANKILKGKTTR